MYNITRDDFVSLYKTHLGHHEGPRFAADAQGRSGEERRRESTHRKKLWCSSNNCKGRPTHMGSQFCPFLSPPSKEERISTAEGSQNVSSSKLGGNAQNSTWGNSSPATIPNASLGQSNLTATFCGLMWSLFSSGHLYLRGVDQGLYLVKKRMLKKTYAQNLLTILGPIGNTNGRGLRDTRSKGQWKSLILRPPIITFASQLRYWNSEMTTKCVFSIANWMRQFFFRRGVPGQGKFTCKVD